MCEELCYRVTVRLIEVFDTDSTARLEQMETNIQTILVNNIVEHGRQLHTHITRILHAHYMHTTRACTFAQVVASGSPVSGSTSSPS